MSTLRRLEGLTLRPAAIDAHGRRWFERRAVALYLATQERKTRIPPLPEGQLAARAFRAFREGARACEVVIACAVTPEVAARWWAAYHGAEGALVVEPADRRQLARLLGRTVEQLDGATLVAIVRRLLLQRRQVSAPRTGAERSGENGATR